MIKNIKKYKSYFYIVLSVFILFLFTNISYYFISSSNKSIYLEQSIKTYQNQIDNTIDTYEIFSSYIFSKIIDDSVLEMMFIAANGDELSQSTQRALLLNYLEEDYEHIIDYSFRQLHFHLPNGDSFLRFHSPDAFGDNLFDIRSSIRIVNTDLIKAKGFEEGRIYNGYRFVYPLFYQDNHVGSVEISISIATLIDALYTIQDDQAHFFIIKRDVVESIVFEDQLDHYADSALSQNYLYDRNVNEQFTDKRIILKGTLLREFLVEISEQIKEELDQEQSFSHTTFHKGKRYIIHFISLKNFDEEHVGYVFNIFIDYTYQQQVIQDFIVYPFILIFYAVMFLSAIIYKKDKENLINTMRVDALTQIANRYYYNQILVKEFQKAQNTHNPLCMIVIDLDYFKEINDTYGHLQGDFILKEVAKLLKRTIRNQDIVARWGGEEFAILLPETDIKEAILVAERIQRSLKEADFGISKKITLSFGISCLGNGIGTIQELFKKADDRMYEAKRRGRDQIIYHDD